MAVKKQTLNSQRSTLNARFGAFTLIELLIVIAIIAILVGLLFSVGPAILDRAKKLQAKNDVTQTVTAVNAYYTEYGRYPTSTTSENALSATDTADLFNTLRATSSSTAMNPRQIVFISPPEDTSQPSPKGKIGSDGQFHDPWGTPYQIAIDVTYDTNIDNPYQADTGAGAVKIRQGAIAWSLGQDKQIGTKGDKEFAGSDDVISWQ